MKGYFFLIIVILSLIVSGCSKQNTTIKQYDLTHKIIDLNPHYYKKGYQFDISNDTLIILDGYAIDTLFHVYNLKTKKLIGKFGNIGDAPDEISRPGFFYWINSQGKVIIVDNARMNLKEFEVNKVLVNDDYQPHEITQPQNISVGFFQSIDDGVFVTRQMDQTDDLLLTFNEDEVLDTIGKWYDNEDPIVLFDEFQQYYYINNKHPNKNIFVTSYFSYDIIQIVNRKTGETIIVQGPDKISYQDNKDEFLAYRWAETTDNYIYANYIGEYSSAGSNNSEYAKEIHVISWEGEHIAKFDLDVPIRFSHVNEEEGFIYALADDENGNFVKFKLPHL